MLRTFMLTALMSWTVILSACTMGDEESLIEDRQGNTLWIAPSNQDPEEQYVLREVTLTSSTRNLITSIHCASEMSSRLTIQRQIFQSPNRSHVNECK